MSTHAHIYLSDACNRSDMHNMQWEDLQQSISDCTLVKVGWLVLKQTVT